MIGGFFDTGPVMPGFCEGKYIRILIKIKYIFTLFH